MMTVTVVALVVAVAVLSVALIVVSRRSQRRGSAEATWRGGEGVASALLGGSAPASSGEDFSMPATIDHSTPVLVQPVSSDFAVVFGPGSALDVFGAAIDEFAPAVAQGICVGNVAVQGLVAAGEASGRLVRLTAASAQALREFGAVRDGAGAIMGVVRGHGGQFAKILRFSTGAGTSAVGAAAAAGPALAALALQMQLQEITKKIDKLDRTATRIETHLSDGLVASVTSDAAALQRATDAYLLTGVIDETDWSSLTPHFKSIRENVEVLRRKLDRATDSIASLVPDGATPSGSTRRDRLAEVLRESRPDQWAYLYYEATTAWLRAEQLEIYRRIATNDPHLHAHVTMSRDRAIAEIECLERTFDRHRTAIESVSLGKMRGGLLWLQSRKSVRRQLTASVAALDEQLALIHDPIRDALRHAMELGLVPREQDSLDLARPTVGHDPHGSAEVP